MDFKVKIALFYLLLAQANALPQTIANDHSFVVRMPRQAQNYGQGGVNGPPRIYAMHVNSNITYRFAHTVITSKVENMANYAQESIFSILLPKDAYISQFFMTTGGKEYDSYVKERNEAQQIYNAAIAGGQSAGLVSASARDSNRFTMSVNVEPKNKITFHLIYEQLLHRDKDQYELVINIHPKQLIPDLRVHVNIDESQPLKFVTAPAIRSGYQLGNINADLDPRAQITMVNANSAVVDFNPDMKRQKELATTLGTKPDEGLAGQFVVQYDVKRNLNGGEILLNDGYFVHFFAPPPGTNSLPKYVLFVLDTSGSMSGNKIRQLKEAMSSILAELRVNDKIQLIEFNSNVKVWDVVSQNPVPYGYNTDITRPRFPSNNGVNAANVKAAIALVQKLQAGGSTNIDDGLKVALYLVDIDKKKYASNNGPQPMIILLTDGEGNGGASGVPQLLNWVKNQNVHKAPIFTLSLGESANKDFLQKLSLQNNAFSRHIYEAADATLQLKDFYTQISSPVLSNVTFKYVDGVKEVSRTTFPIAFDGSELVVVGQMDKNKNMGSPTITAAGNNGPIVLKPEVKKPIKRLERLWAYKTIQQLVEDSKKSNDKTSFEKKALDIALKYQFVTPVSSLMVVKPNAAEAAVIPVAADPVPGAPVPQPVTVPPITQQELDDYLKQMFNDALNNIPITSTFSAEELIQELPWIEPILTDDTITTSKGSYKLGLDETSTDNVPCPSTPELGPGFCKLLHECQQVHYLVTDVNIFQQHYCEMKGFAAICCPDA